MRALAALSQSQAQAGAAGVLGAVFGPVCAWPHSTPHLSSHRRGVAHTYDIAHATCHCQSSATHQSPDLAPDIPGSYLPYLDTQGRPPTTCGVIMAFGPAYSRNSHRTVGAPAAAAPRLVQCVSGPVTLSVNICSRDPIPTAVYTSVMHNASAVHCAATTY